MATSKVIYNGNLRTEATHIASSDTIITDAPLDNNGRGEAFSPTDLVATALASCMITVMGIKANQMNINIDGIRSEVIKVMASDPRRISEIKVHLKMPSNNYTHKDRKILEAIANTCPVAMSLHPDIKQIITFDWD